MRSIIATSAAAAAYGAIPATAFSATLRDRPCVIGCSDGLRTSRKR